MEDPYDYPPARLGTTIALVIALGLMGAAGALIWTEWRQCAASMEVGQ